MGTGTGQGNDQSMSRKRKSGPAAAISNLNYQTQSANSTADGANFREENEIGHGVACMLCTSSVAGDGIPLRMKSLLQFERSIKCKRRTKKLPISNKPQCAICGSIAGFFEPG